MCVSGDTHTTLSPLLQCVPRVMLDTSAELPLLLTPVLMRAALPGRQMAQLALCHTYTHVVLIHTLPCLPAIRQPPSLLSPLPSTLSSSPFPCRSCSILLSIQSPPSPLLSSNWLSCDICWAGTRLSSWQQRREGGGKRGRRRESVALLTAGEGQKEGETRREGEVLTDIGRKDG